MKADRDNAIFPMTGSSNLGQEMEERGVSCKPRVKHPAQASARPIATLA